MPPMPPRRTNPTDLIAHEVEKWMNLTIDLYDFDTYVPYNSTTDTGGYSVPILVLTSKARLQQLGAPKEANAGGEWVVARAVRFHLPRENAYAFYPANQDFPSASDFPSATDFPTDGKEPIRKGLVIRVRYFAGNRWLSEYAYTVLSSINSGYAGVCTVECMSELAVVPKVVA